MIDKTEGFYQPISAGQSRELTIWTSSPILKVEIVCYVDPPGKFQPCPECGSISAQSGVPFSVDTNLKIFGRGGELQVTVREIDGTATTLPIKVVSIQDDNGGGLVMGG